MFAIAARRMGYRVHTLSPADDTPTGQVADLEINAAYDDLDAVRRFAENVDVLTFEFENISAAAAETAERYCPVRPSGRVLHTTQHRLREKTFLRSAGFPVTPFETVRSLADLERALASLGCPAVLKTAGWGYDGKGQVKITSPAEAVAAWQSMQGQEAVLEAWVAFEQEVSVVAARGIDGSGRLRRDCQRASPPYPGHFDRAGRGRCGRVARSRRDCPRRSGGARRGGVLCVEFLLTNDGRLLVNELAPRPHNSAT